MKSEPTLDAAYSRALGVLRAAAPEARQYLSQNAIKMGDAVFSGMDRGLKESHSNQVAQARQSHESIVAAPGVVLESLILRSQKKREGTVAGKGWFSSGSITCRLVKTSDYDDFCGGVDFVMTFKKSDGTILLALAVDATQGSSSQTDKLTSITNAISGEEKPKSVAYFTDPDSDMHGQLHNVPAFITALDPMHVAELELLRREKGDAALAEHPAQIVLLTQLTEQARIFAKMALGAQGKGNKLHEKYTQAQRVLSEVLGGKLAGKQWDSWAADDKAWKTLTHNLQRLDGPDPSQGPIGEHSRVVMASGKAGGNPRAVLVETKKTHRIDKDLRQGAN